MLEQSLRPLYQTLLVDPVATAIYQKINPLYITLVSGVIGMLIIPAIYYQHIALALLCLIVSGYLDTLDGTVARQAQLTSPFGTVMDIITDRIVEFSAIFGLWLVDPLHRSLLSLLMLGSILICITSFLVVGIFTPNNTEKGFHYSPGLMERAEAFIFFALMLLLPSFFISLASVFVILVSYTTIKRLYEFRLYTRG